MNKFLHALTRSSSNGVDDLYGLLEASGIDRRKFNRANQGKWIEKISAWAQEETQSYQLPDALEKFSQRFLEERTKAGGITPQHPLFVAIDELLSEPLTLRDLVITRALAEIRAAVAEEKRRRGELGSAVWMRRCAVKAVMRWRRLFVPVFRLP